MNIFALIPLIFIAFNVIQSTEINYLDTSRALKIEIAKCVANDKHEGMDLLVDRLNDGLMEINKGLHFDLSHADGDFNKDLKLFKEKYEISAMNYSSCVLYLSSCIGGIPKPPAMDKAFKIIDDIDCNWSKYSPELTCLKRSIDLIKKSAQQVDAVDR